MKARAYSKLLSEWPLMAPFGRTSISSRGRLSDANRTHRGAARLSPSGILLTNRYRLGRSPVEGELDLSQIRAIGRTARANLGRLLTIVRAVVAEYFGRANSVIRQDTPVALCHHCSVVSPIFAGCLRQAPHCQRPVPAEGARWGRTESAIAFRERSWTDRAAIAEIAALAMM